MVEMELVGIEEVQPGHPVVVLQERAGARRLLYIYIGEVESRAIVDALRGKEYPRPLTHDLMRDVLEAVSMRLREVVISDMRDDTFYAELHLVGGDGVMHPVSSRPSDALALVARLHCPVYADESVMEMCGESPEPEVAVSAASADEMVEEFRSFLDSVNPDDFGA